MHVSEHHNGRHTLRYHRKTRRGAFASGLGLAVTAAGRRALAQEATPEVATPVADPTDLHRSADDSRPDPEFLFVQPFDSGSWVPKPGVDGVFTLTLTGAAGLAGHFRTHDVEDGMEHHLAIAHAP